MADKETIKRAYRNTHAIYDRHAQTWHDGRDGSLYEAPLLERLLSKAPAAPHILDIGCGSGEPIGRYFLQQGARYTGVDYSPAMIDLARGTLPDGEWHIADMRALALSQTFDIIISWDGFFHLRQDEQRAALPRIAKLLNDGGQMLLTIGNGDGEVTGTIGAETVYHASLSPDEYIETLKALGFASVDVTLDVETARGRNILHATGFTPV